MSYCVGFRDITNCSYLYKIRRIHELNGLEETSDILRHGRRVTDRWTHTDRQTDTETDKIICIHTWQRDSNTPAGAMNIGCETHVCSWIWPAGRHVTLLHCDASHLCRGDAGTRGSKGVDGPAIIFTAGSWLLKFYAHQNNFLSIIYV